MPDEAVVRSGRIEARERALELLYEAELKSLEPREVLASLPLAPDAFTRLLVEGVSDHREEIDADLTRVSRGWDLDRMPVIDRSVLRIGTFELGWNPEIPTAVVLNEAVELARRFSTEKSSKFVNGVLSRLATDHRGTARAGNGDRAGRAVGGSDGPESDVIA